MALQCYVPDLPGCVTCGDTIEEAQTLIAEANRGACRFARIHGEPVPPPSARAFSVKAA